MTDDHHQNTAPAVKADMLIRRPVHETFEAFVDPQITTRFWFTKSSGRLEPGATVEWTWEDFDVTAAVHVKEVEADSRILIEWDEPPTQVEWRFTPQPEETTLVTITETGFSGTVDERTARAIDSTGGFTMVLCAVKALLEHGIVLTVVRDSHVQPTET